MAGQLAFRAGALLAAAMFFALLPAFHYWHRFRRLSITVRTGALGLLGAFGFCLFLMDFLLPLPRENPGTPPSRDVIEWLSKVLPQSTGLLLMVLIVVLLGLYALVSKLFDEAEYAEKPRTASA